MTRHISTEAFPPGEYLQDAMNARNWTQDDLAEVMRCTRQHVNRLINGHTAITADTAQSLAAAFGTSAQLWMNLQTAFELSMAAKENRDIEQRSVLYSRYPVRELHKRGWIKSIASTDAIATDLCRIMRVDSLDEAPSIRVAARKSGTYEEQTPAQVLWYSRARELADAVQSSTFSDHSLEQGIPELLKLAAFPEDARRVPKLLAEIGVRLVIVEHLPHTKVDGAAFWVGNSPVVALSIRYDRIDNFWFTLMHELVHVKYRDESPIDVDIRDCAGTADFPGIEERANREACNYLIPREKLHSFVERNQHVFSQAKISQFAQARGVHPGIVVGLLHGMGPEVLDFKFHRRQLVKVRDNIVSSALTDGWGKTPLNLD